MAGIVVEVTHAITEQLLERVVYLRNPDRARQGRGRCCRLQRPLRHLLRRLDPPKEPTIRWSWCHHPRKPHQEEEEEEAILLGSAQESEAGEEQHPEPAAGPIQGVKDRRRAMEAEMANIRRTLNRHSYRLGFVQRGMVHLRNMMQRSGRGQQQRRGRRRLVPLGSEAPWRDSPPASGGEGGKGT
ncbi:UNVERIFIED_CONTAM: hypothetical protein K2H54_006223 [Gekko kuhli]